MIREYPDRHPKAEENPDATVTAAAKKHQKQEQHMASHMEEEPEMNLLSAEEGKAASALSQSPAVGKKQKQNLVVQIGSLNVVRPREAH